MLTRDVLRTFLRESRTVMACADLHDEMKDILIASLNVPDTGL